MLFTFDTCYTVDRLNLATGKFDEFWSARKVDFSLHFMGHLGKSAFQSTPLLASIKPFKDVLALKFKVWCCDQFSDALITNINFADTQLSLKISTLNSLRRRPIAS